MFYSYTISLRHFNLGAGIIDEIFIPVDLEDFKRVSFLFDVPRIVSGVHTLFVDTGNLNAPPRNMTPVNSNISTIFTNLLNVETGVTSINQELTSRRIIANATATTSELMITTLNITADLARGGISIRYISGAINEAPVLFQFVLQY